MTNTYDEYVEKAARLALAKPALPAHVIITAGSCHVANIQAHNTKGTHVLTVKGRRP